jgi:hypothetical protein
MTHLPLAFNPGSDPVKEATLEQAQNNMQVFLEDVSNPAIAAGNDHWVSLPELGSIACIELTEETLDEVQQRFQKEGRFHFFLRSTGARSLFGPRL